MVGDRIGVLLLVLILFFLILDVILLKLFVISFFSKWVQLIFVDGYDFLQLLLIYWIFYVCL